jgi:hypothetical protein
VPKPDRTIGDPKELLLGYLDYYRSVVARKVADLDERAARTSTLPSGWTPLELVNHLAHLERRWLVWAFAGEPVEHPHADEDEHGRWRTGPDETVTGLLAELTAAGERTRRIATTAALDDIAATGGRYTDSDTRPTLVWTLVYVLQEYARHAGHLAIARELADGVTGE